MSGPAALLAVTALALALGCAPGFDDPGVGDEARPREASSSLAPRLRADLLYNRRAARTAWGGWCRTRSNA